MKSKFSVFAVITGALLFAYAVYTAEGNSDARFPVKAQGKWGYIDKTGKLIIQPRFDDAKPYSEGLAQVKN